MTLSQDQKLRHFACLGPTGAGKSRFLEHVISQDLGGGVCLIEPEGGLTHRILARLVSTHDDLEELAERVVIIEPHETSYSLPLNILSGGTNDYITVEHCIHAFKRAWQDSWGARMEDILRNLLLFLQVFDLTLSESVAVLSNRKFRLALAKKLDDPGLRDFWVHHLEGIRQSEFRFWVESSRNKLNQFVQNPFINPLVSQKGCFDLQKAMDEGKIVLLNINQAVLRETGNLLAMLFLARLYLAALSRDERDPRPFYLYADEFNSYATETFLELLTRGRKRGIGVHLFFQNLNMPPFDKDRGYIETILSNCHNLISFRSSRKDAERLVGEVFRFSGANPKVRKRHWLLGEYGPPSYWSVTEEKEHYITELSDQADRECIISIKGAKPKPPWFAKTLDVPDDLGASDEQVQAFKELCFKAHCTPKVDIDRQLKERRERIRAILEPPKTADVDVTRVGKR